MTILQFAAKHTPHSLAHAQSATVPVIAAFDFDVTMTTKDTFLPFLFRAFGKRRVLTVLARLSVDAFMVAARLSSRDAFKEKLIQALFRGESEERLRAVGLAHASEIRGWIRPAALARLQWHKARGDRLIMVSASLDLYLKPVARALGFDDVLCTTPSVVAGRFDGTLAGRNCRAQEKVNRLRAQVGELAGYRIFAYGDSAGDAELLACADHAFYRAFEGDGLALTTG